MYSCILVLDFLFLAITTVTASTCTSSLRIDYNAKDGLKDRALEDQRILKITRVDHDPQCFQECSKDCRCLSFNVCGQTCQLNGGNRFHARNSLRVKPGCRYYDMPLPKNNCALKKPRGVCCARLSPPCFNGGICYTNITDTTSRFQCECPSGYYGNQCQVKNPKSCLGYWTDTIKPISQEYIMEDEDGSSYKTFCDFDSENAVAWTLIESFKLENEASVINFPLTLDQPLNEVFNWELFRLPKNVMVGIGSGSTYWRGTCSYPEYGIDYQDYVRVRMSVLDPTIFLGGPTFSSEACILIDYIDIKGKHCMNCTTTIFQLATEMLHISPFWGRVHHGCNFDTTDVEYQCPGTSEYARLLGVYQLCSDPSYRCSETPSSTTQIWFGEIKV